MHFWFRQNNYKIYKVLFGSDKKAKDKTTSGKNQYKIIYQMHENAFNALLVVFLKITFLLINSIMGYSMKVHCPLKAKIKQCEKGYFMTENV